MSPEINSSQNTDSVYISMCEQSFSIDFSLGRLTGIKRFLAKSIINVRKDQTGCTFSDMTMVRLFIFNDNSVIRHYVVQTTVTGVEYGLHYWFVFQHLSQWCLCEDVDD